MELLGRSGFTFRTLARLVACAMIATPVGIVGCGGSVGVSNGTIVGRVYGNPSGGSATPTPLSGVTVVAQRQDSTPAVLRTTVTDRNGEYVFANIPTGSYNLGYSRRGFQTIDTATGASQNQVPQGELVNVFVEPGATGIAPDITLAKLLDEGDSTVAVTLVDSITGDPVTNATITIGAATTSNGGANGVYTLSVPVRREGGGEGVNALPPIRLLHISAAGYDAVPSDPPMVRPIAYETVTLTVQVAPNQGRITGFIRIAQFETLYDRSLITVSVDNVPVDFTDGQPNGQADAVVNSNGFFSILVPASHSALTRQFNLNFTSPGLQPTVVSNVVAPTSFSTRQLTSPVVMQPVTVDIVGTVVDSSGNAPNQLNPQGIPDTVTIVETGQVGNIINGAYTIPDVPITGDPMRNPQLTLSATAFNPSAPNATGGFGVQEINQGVPIAPTSDGTPNPTFTAPLIRTQ